tara:strand:- start:110 stop:301 length:192 start_codon:yes stop_codon:yes gene_type:complete
MALLSKLKDTIFSKFPGTKPTGPLTKDGKTFEKGTYQNYLVDVASSTADEYDDDSFPTRSTKQ